MYRITVFLSESRLRSGPLQCFVDLCRHRQRQCKQIINFSLILNHSHWQHALMMNCRSV